MLAHGVSRRFRGRVKLLANGPPVPYPVQFRVIGLDRWLLRERADEVKAIDAREAPTPGASMTTGTNRSRYCAWKLTKPKARALGVTTQSHRAGARKTILSGSTVGQFREGDKLIDIVLRQPLDERNAITDIANAYLPTASGKSIPLTQIAKPRLIHLPGSLA